jgi:hypothetical protein
MCFQKYHCQLPPQGQALHQQWPNLPSQVGQYQEYFLVGPKIHQFEVLYKWLLLKFLFLFFWEASKGHSESHGRPRMACGPGLVTPALHIHHWHHPRRRRTPRRPRSHSLTNKFSRWTLCHCLSQQKTTKVSEKLHTIPSWNARCYLGYETFLHISQRVPLHPIFWSQASGNIRQSSHKNFEQTSRSNE